MKQIYKLFSLKNTRNYLTGLILIACSAISYGQWVENFDAGTTLPTGWAVINDGGANAWGITSSISGGTHSGVNSMRIRFNTTAHDDYLITKAIPVVSGTSDYISFYVRSRSSTFADAYKVLLSTTDQTKAAFTVELQAEENAPNTSWDKQEFDLSAYNGQTVYVAVQATSKNKFELYADSFRVDKIPTCISPTNIQSSNVTDATASLSWTAPSPVPASGYEYYTSTTNTAPESSTMGTAVSGTTANLTGLMANQIYYIWVRSVCSATDKGTWSSPSSFTTECAIETLDSDYIEDFAVFLDACWSEGNNTDVAAGPNTTNGSWATDTFMNTSITNDSNRGARINLYGNTQKDWLVSPTFNIPTGNDTYEVKYDFGIVEWNKTSISQLGSDDQILFLISVNGGAWTTLKTYDSSYTTPTGGDLEVTYDLANYQGKSVQFAFWATDGAVNDPEDNDISIDNFKVQKKTVLSLENNIIEGFRHYPNPVSNQLTITAKETIENVVVFNLVGQKVAAVKTNKNNVNVNLSNLKQGIYFVKVEVDGKQKSFKVIKK